MEPLPRNTDWRLEPWSSLSLGELYAIMAARQRVFIVEQDCPYLDADGYDPLALHLWKANGEGEMLAYLRVFGPGVKYPECSLGRVITAPEVRRTGLGRELVARGIAVVRERFHPPSIRISAQRYLERFYSEFGFVSVGEGYIEDRIPHIEMLLPAG